MLSGKLVVLRPVTRDDLRTLESLANDRDYHGRNFSGLCASNACANEFAKNGLLGRRGGTLIVSNRDGEFAGDISYWQVCFGPEETSPAYGIGLSILGKFRNRGYGSEAQRLLAEYLLATYPVARIQADTDVDNRAEQEALEKAGFRREGVRRQIRFAEGVWHDLALYSLTRSDLAC